MIERFCWGVVGFPDGLGPLLVFKPKAFPPRRLEPTPSLSPLLPPPTRFHLTRRCPVSPLSAPGSLDRGTPPPLGTDKDLFPLLSKVTTFFIYPCVNPLLINPDGYFQVQPTGQPFTKFYLSIPRIFSLSHAGTICRSLMNVLSLFSPRKGSRGSSLLL